MGIVVAVIRVVSNTLCAEIAVEEGLLLYLGPFVKVIGGVRNVKFISMHSVKIAPPAIVSRMATPRL